MNDATDRRLRQLAEALVADRPSTPSIEAGPVTSYLDRRVADRRPRSRVIGGVAVATLLVAGGIALAQGRSAMAPNAVMPRVPLVAVTPTPGASTIDPAALLDHPYQLARGSADDATQNLVTPIGLDDVPAGVIAWATPSPRLPSPCRAHLRWRSRRAMGPTRPLASPATRASGATRAPRTSRAPEAATFATTPSCGSS